MKKFIVLFFVFCIHSAFAQNIEPRPVPPRGVNDFGHMLEPFQVQALEQKVDAYNDSTSSAIVIVTVPTLNGYDIAEVSLKYLRNWGIGTKEKNNGVLILVSKDDHKARIETGYGMEGVLPDIIAKEIIDDRMIPAFKSNDYYRGFDNALNAIIQAAAGEYKATPKSNTGGGAGSIIVLVVLFIIIVAVVKGGGGRGGGGGSYMSRRGATSGLPWFLLGNMLGSGGGGGGFGGGGRFGGGGGGGFGGFGGGGGGGGGASGGW